MFLLLLNRYIARAALEDEFSRKLLALSKKPLGSVEFGSLKSSMDVLRLEVESMAKAHQNIANQMKTELDEPLTAFSGAMRERRKIIQGGCEKLLKLKMQQTQQVNKVGHSHPNAHSLSFPVLGADEPFLLSDQGPI